LLAQTFGFSDMKSTGSSIISMSDLESKIVEIISEIFLDNDNADNYVVSIFRLLGLPDSPSKEQFEPFRNKLFHLFYQRAISEFSALARFVLEYDMKFGWGARNKNFHNVLKGIQKICDDAGLDVGKQRPPKGSVLYESDQNVCEWFTYELRTLFFICFL
jgi:hypothetical protein